MTKQIILFLALLIFNSCSDNTPADEKQIPIITTNETKSNSRDTLSNETLIKKQDVRTDCIRGQAEPIIKKNVFPKTTFVLQADRLSAFETIKFDNGDKLIIHNCGCEYYVLNFRFETSRFKNDTADISHWYKNSVLLLYELFNGIDAPINIQKGTKELVNYIDNSSKTKNGQLQLKQEIDFGGKEIRTFVSLDRIEKINDNKFAVEISFVTGPL